MEQLGSATIRVSPDLQDFDQMVERLERLFNGFAEVCAAYLAESKTEDVPE